MNENPVLKLHEFRVPESNVFLMTRFRDTAQHKAISGAVEEAVGAFGLKFLRADNDNLRDFLLWDKVQSCMEASHYGVALFEAIDEQDFNPNVSLELGYMMALRREYLLLKEQRLKKLPTDLCGHLYKEFDSYNISPTVLGRISDWLKPIGVRKRDGEKLIVFVSYGGQDRCAIAKAITNHLLDKENFTLNFRIESRGVESPTEPTAAKSAIEAVRERLGRDWLGDHRPRRAGVAFLFEANLILATDDQVLSKPLTGQLPRNVTACRGGAHLTLTHLRVSLPHRLISSNSAIRGRTEMSHSGYLRVCLTVVAIAVAISHAKWPSVTIDGVTLGLIVLAVLPWLAPIIKSIELPGVGKIELQEVRAQVEELRGQTASASQKADTALASKTTSLPSAVHTPEALSLEQRFLTLAAKYNHIRKTQKPGGLRTGAMTEVVGEMIALAPSVPIATVSPFLTEEDDGKRLFAYAHIYARPEPQLLSDLVRCVTEKEHTPFGQYWGIQAIGRVVQAAPESATLQNRNALQNFLAKLKKGTDRYYELSKIMKSLDDSA